MKLSRRAILSFMLVLPLTFVIGATQQNCKVNASHAHKIVKIWNRPSQRYNHHLILDHWSDLSGRSSYHPIYNKPSFEHGAKPVFGHYGGAGVYDTAVNNNYTNDKRPRAIVSLSGLKQVPNVFQNKNFIVQRQDNHKSRFNLYTGLKYPHTNKYIKPVYIHDYRWRTVPNNYVAKRKSNWMVICINHGNHNQLVNLIKHLPFKVYRGATENNHERYYEIISKPNVKPRIRGWIFRHGIDVNNVPLDTYFAKQNIKSDIQKNLKLSKMNYHQFRKYKKIEKAGSDGIPTPLNADTIINFFTATNKISHMQNKSAKKQMKHYVMKNFKRMYRNYNQKRYLKLISLTIKKHEFPKNYNQLHKVINNNYGSLSEYLDDNS